MNPTSAFTRPARATALAAAVALLGALAGPAAWAQAAAAPAAAASAPTLRADVGKPMQAAQEALKAGDNKLALAKLAEVEAIGNLTPYETYILRRLKAPALYGSGDVAGALAEFERVLPMAALPADDLLPLRLTAAKLALQLKDYAKAVPLVKAYLAGGGQDAEIKRIQPQLMSLTGDHAGVVRELGAVVDADEAAGRVSPEATLRLLAGSQNELGDKAAYQRTVQRLAASTGKAEYWGMVINAVVRKDGFAEDRLRLDVYRLRRAAGLSLQGPELADMAYRAQQAGLPAEAQALMDEGYSQKLLGVGADAAADQKLRDVVNKAAANDKAALADSEAAAGKAKDGNAPFNLGLAMSGAGLHERGLALMAAGQAKGGLRRPDDALLHLAVAQVRAGKTDDALKTLAGVQGADGTAELARLWTLLLRSPAKPK